MVILRESCVIDYAFLYKITYLDAASLHSFHVIRVTQNAWRIETEFVRDTGRKCSRSPPHKLSYLKRIFENTQRDATMRGEFPCCVAATQIRFLEITDFVIEWN